MKAIRKPLTAECFRYTGNHIELQKWLASLGCTNISITTQELVTFEEKLRDYEVIIFNHEFSRYRSIPERHALSDYIVFTPDTWGRLFTHMSERDFNHLYEGQND